MATPRFQLTKRTVLGGPRERPPASVNRPLVQLGPFDSNVDPEAADHSLDEFREPRWGRWRYVNLLDHGRN